MELTVHRLQLHLFAVACSRLRIPVALVVARCGVATSSAYVSSLGCVRELWWHVFVSDCGWLVFYIENGSKAFFGNIVHDFDNI